MTDTIPERRRTLVGSPPRRQQLEGREAVERAIRFIRCRPRVRPYSAVGHMRPPWLGPAAGLNLNQLEALLRGEELVYSDGTRFVSLTLVGDELQRRTSDPFPQPSTVADVMASFRDPGFPPPTHRVTISWSDPTEAR